MKIEYSKQAVKFLNKQNKSVRERIVNAINNIPEGDKMIL